MFPSKVLTGYGPSVHNSVLGEDRRDIFWYDCVVTARAVCGVFGCLANNTGLCCC